MPRQLYPLVMSAHGVFTPGIVISDSDGAITDVIPFTRETANTTFNSRCIAILRHDAVTEFLLDDIALIDSQCGDSKSKQSRLDTLFRASSLYAPLPGAAALIDI